MGYEHRCENCKKVIDGILVRGICAECYDAPLLCQDKLVTLGDTVECIECRERYVRAMARSLGDVQGEWVGETCPHCGHGNEK